MPKKKKEIETLTSTDRDSINTVRVFMERRGCRTFAEALDKLIASAAVIGLHVRDISPTDLNPFVKPGHQHGRG